MQVRLERENISENVGEKLFSMGGGVCVCRVFGRGGDEKYAVVA